MQKLKLLLRKRNNQIILALLLVVVYVVISGMRSSTVTTSPFSKFTNNGAPVTSIQVVTNPVGASVTLGSLGFSSLTPMYSEDVSAGDYTLRVERAGYFTVEKKINLKSGTKNEFAINLNKAPELDLSYKGRMSGEGRLIGSSSTGRPYLVSYHPGIRTIEASTGRDSFTVLPNILKDVFEIHWDNNSQRLIAMTGRTKAEKKSYLVDFSGITDLLVQKPVVTPLAYPGANYSWAPTNDAVAYYGDINYTTGQSKLFTQLIRSIPTERSPVGSIIGSGVNKLFWLANDAFVSVQEVEGGEEFGDSTDLYLISSKDGTTWSQELVSNNLVSKAVISPDRSTIAYVSGSLVVAQNMLTGVKYDLGSLAEFGPNITLAFYDPTTVLITSFVDGLGFEFYLLGLESKEFQKVTLEAALKAGVLKESYIMASMERLIVSFTSGDTYTFKL